VHPVNPAAIESRSAIAPIPISSAENARLSSPFSPRCLFEKFMRNPSTDPVLQIG
jgi:hypothetical protein